MPTVTELGAKVKAKYPGTYDDLPDQEVGRKVKAKYPDAYSDFSDAPPHSENVIGGRTLAISEDDHSTLANIARWLQTRVDALGAGFKRMTEPGVDAKLGGASDVVREVGKAALPLAAPAMLAHPVRALATLATGAAAGGAGEAIASHYLDPGASEAVGTVAGIVGGSYGDRAAGAVSDLASRVWAIPEARQAALELLPKGAKIAKALKAFQAMRGQVEPEHAVDLDALAKDWFSKAFDQLSLEQQTKVRGLADRLDKPVPPDINQKPDQSRTGPGLPRYNPNEPAGRSMADIVRDEVLGTQAPPAAVVQPTAAARARGSAPGAPQAAALPAGEPLERDLYSSEYSARPGEPPAAPPNPENLRATEPQDQTPAPPATETSTPAPAATEGAAEPRLGPKERNRQAYAKRFAQALHEQGIDAFDAAEIPRGYFSLDQIQRGMSPGWDNLAEHLGEKAPSLETIGQIVEELGKIGERPAVASNPKALEIAEQLKHEIESPSTEAPAAPAAPAGERSTITPNGESSQNAAGAADRGTARESRPISEPRRPTNPTAPGAETSIRVPGSDRAYAAQYSVRELDDVHASHNPYTFEKNPNYQLVNDRNYADPANAERIVRQSQKFDPAYLLTESPDAGNGAPVITADGNVLGGNSRTMTLERVYNDHPESADAYREHMLRRAHLYGIDPDQVASMKRPVLVREIPNSEWDRLATEQQHAVTDFNKTGTATLTAAERATADARNLSPELADYIAKHIEATGPNATLADAMSGRRGAEIINKLTDEGLFTHQEKPELIDSRTGAITAKAKERVGKMLTGQLFRDSEQFARTPPELRNKLERTVAPLMQVQTRPEWDLVPEVRDAIDILEYARAHGITKLSDLTSQESMFGGGPEYTPRAIQLADAIKNETPTMLAKLFKEYAIGSRGSMFGDATPEQVFEDVFGGGAENERAIR